VAASKSYAFAMRFTRTRLTGVFFTDAFLATRFLAVRAVDLRADVARVLFFFTDAFAGAVL
jgi:hypothetical protein